MESLAHAHQLLVISDFDGTIAGFSPDLYDVPLTTTSLAALSRLAGLPRTSVAILSGRHLDGLRRVCPLAPPVIFAGSHGNESSLADEPTAEQRAVLAATDAALAPLLTKPGTHLEVKPFQRVAHVFELARTDPAAADAVLAAVDALDIPGARKTHGHCIIEFSATDVTKGTWITATRDRLSADAVVFAGDDRTDEDGFAVLRPTDHGIKVGDGDTAATSRVTDRHAMGDWFTRLAAARTAALPFPTDPAARTTWLRGEIAALTHLAHNLDAATPTGRSAAETLAAVDASAQASAADLFYAAWDVARSQGLTAQLPAALARELAVAAGAPASANPVAAALRAAGRDPQWSRG